MSDFLLPSYDPYHAGMPVFTGACDDKLYTEQGAVLDFLCGAYCSAMLGHGDREVRAAMAHGFSADLIGSLHRPAVDLAEELCRRTGYARVGFGTSGSEAADAAIRMVYQCWRAQGRAADGRCTILTLFNGFHGTTLATLTTSGFRRRVEIMPGAGVTHVLGRWITDVSIASLAEARRALDAEAVDWSRLGGFLFEPVQGVAGIRPVNLHCYRAVAERCRELGALVVADEITTGIGRTGRFLTTEAFMPKPDIVLLGKALTNGEFPLSAVLLSDTVWRVLDAASDDPYEKYLFGSTYAGHPTGCLAALAVLRKIDGACLARIRQAGEIIDGILGTLKQGMPAVRAVRGLGLMWGLEFRDPVTCTRIVSDLLQRGFRCSAEGKVLVIFPNLQMDIESAVTRLACAIKAVVRDPG